MSNLLVPERNLEHAHVLVELFDERTGRKVDEVDGENYITPAGIAHNRWKVRNDYMGSMPGSGNADTEPHAPFAAVYISDSAEAIDTNSSYPEGQVIAWSNKASYTGADTRRGTPNSPECAADTAMARWVFDWPTHAGNGTLRSVGWKGQDGDFSGVTASSNNLLGTTIAGSGLVWMPSQSGWYVAPYGPTNPATGKLVTSWDPLTYSDFGPPGNGLGFTGSYLGNVAVDASYMYFTLNGLPANMVNSTGVRRINLPSGTGAAVGATWINVPGHTSGIVGVTYEPGADMLWVCSYSANKVIRINKATGAIDREFTSPAPGGVSYWAARNSLLVTTGQQVTEYDFDGNVRSLWALGKVSNSASQVVETETVDGSPLFRSFSHNGSNQVYASQRPTVGSRVLLPSSLTKNSLQTMKLTYTFTYT